MTFSFIGYYWNLESLFGGFYKEVQLLCILDDAGPPLFGEGCPFGPTEGDGCAGSSEGGREDSRQPESALAISGVTYVADSLPLHLHNII